MRWTGQKVTVLGAGISGQAAVQFLQFRGAKVFLSEKGQVPLSIRLAGVAFEEGGHTGRTLLCDAMVVSPGIPPYRFPVRKAKEIGIPIWTEVELGLEEVQGSVVAITGTNGKTTVTTLLHRLIPGSHLVGNVGQPLSIYPYRRGIFVLELSSFQLTYLHKFRPQIAVLLNLSLDHLDWHRTVEEYYASKLRIFRWQSHKDEALLNADDPMVVLYAKEVPSRVFWFSVRRPVEPGIYLQNHEIRIVGPQGTVKVAYPRTPATDYYREDLLPAILAAYHLGVPLESILGRLRSFHGLPHRLEYVVEFKGVVFVNDSKATNPHATRFALERVDAPVILILGGDAKGIDLTELRDIIHQKVRAIVAIGDQRDQIVEDFGDLVDVQPAASMEEAVVKAYQTARPGDIVLLSPACASFDWFRNYKERGRQFRNAVRNLTSGRI